MQEIEGWRVKYNSNDRDHTFKFQRFISPALSTALKVNRQPQSLKCNVVHTLSKQGESEQRIRTISMHSLRRQQKQHDMKYTSANVTLTAQTKASAARTQTAQSFSGITWFDQSATRRTCMLARRGLAAWREFNKYVYFYNHIHCRVSFDNFVRSWML